MRVKNKGFFTVAAAIVTLAVLIGVIGYFYINSGESEDLSKKITSPLNVAINNPTSTPIQTATPFEELTIPYLRSRQYNSQLGELVKYEDNFNYTSYIATYDSDGLKINGLLTIPKTSKPAAGFPAVVFVHGYIPPTEYQTAVNYNSYVDYLAKNGFVVFKIDLRGHGESEGEPGGAYYSGDYVIDTLNARSALQSADFVNSDAIGLWGHSMAGNVIFRSFVAATDIPAIVIWAGAVYTYEDFSEYRIEDNSYRPPPVDSPRQQERDLLNETHGSFDPASDFWKQVPATNYLKGVSGALQVHHATDDNVVSVNYSRNLDTLLDQSAIVHEIFEYSSGGHNLTGSSFNQAMQRTADFFRLNLN